MSVKHSTFAIVRVYPAPPARVFAAFADPAQKIRWFSCAEDWETLGHELDLRTGGSERLRVRPPGGAVHRNETHYHEVIESRRIVYAYEMYVGETRISVSLATIELTPVALGTEMRFTEQLALLDPSHTAEEREEGTRIGLANLATFLRSTSH